ncbi:MAG TPA: hypothetical protein VGG39_08105 [Polyangiaceae bacterium]|jgi:hypothetical protein
MSSTTSKAPQAVTLAQLQALIAGLQSQLPSGSFLLGGQTYTSAALVSAFQGTIAALAALTAAHAGVTVALAAFQAALAKTGPLSRALKRTLQEQYANAPDTLALFGLKPRKVPAPRTAAEIAAAAAKAKATREARGTTSKKQKLAVTGNVTGVTIMPTTTPAPSPEPSAQQAPATPSATPPVAGK